MEIKISDLAQFLQSLPEDNETRTYIDATDEFSFADWLYGDIDMQLAEHMGCSITWHDDTITINNPEEDLSVLTELENLTEEQFMDDYTKLTGFCDGGDDFDYAQGMPAILGDLITLYLNHK